MEPTRQSEADVGYTYALAARLLGLSPDGISKRVKAGKLATVAPLRVSRTQVEAERVELLRHLEATDARVHARHDGGTIVHAEPVPQDNSRRLRAREAALSEALDDAYREARKARQERDQWRARAATYRRALLDLLRTESKIAEGASLSDVPGVASGESDRPPA